MQEKTNGNRSTLAPRWLARTSSFTPWALPSHFGDKTQHGSSAETLSKTIQHAETGPATHVSPNCSWQRWHHDGKCSTSLRGAPFPPPSWARSPGAGSSVSPRRAGSPVRAGRRLAGRLEWLRAPGPIRDRGRPRAPGAGGLPPWRLRGRQSSCSSRRQASYGTCVARTRERSISERAPRPRGNQGGRAGKSGGSGQPVVMAAVRARKGHQRLIGSDGREENCRIGMGVGA